MSVSNFFHTWKKKGLSCSSDVRHILKKSLLNHSIILFTKKCNYEMQLHITAGEVFFLKKKKRLTAAQTREERVVKLLCCTTLPLYTGLLHRTYSETALICIPPLLDLKHFLFLFFSSQTKSCISECCKYYPTRHFIAAASPNLM